MGVHRAPAAELDSEALPGTWLIDESQPLDEAALARSLAAGTAVTRGRKPSLAIRMNDVVHETKKWFGGADIRLDTIVVNGVDGDGAAQHFYQPGTFRFSDIRKGERLPIEAPGLLVFYGQPIYFIDISIMVSRDRSDSEDLGDLISARLNAAEWQTAAGSVLGLAMAAPQAAAVTAAVAGAAVIGKFAADVLRSVTGDTIGLYRVSWLQQLDRFGLGRHPENDVFRARDLSFWYEIVPDQARRRRPAERDEH